MSHLQNGRRPARARPVGHDGLLRRVAQLAIPILVVVFLILFPKGGFQVSGIPITWGYLLLGFGGMLALASTIVLHNVGFSPRWFFSLWCALPFGFYAIISLYLLDIASPTSVIVTGTVVVVLPVLFLFALGPWLDRTKDMALLLRFARGCLFWVAVLGFIFFAYYTVTKKTFEIPFLTVNGADENALLGKNNARGELQKMASTYNNGNIFGICVLMMLPVYCVLEKRVWRQYFLKLALFLTLSRSVWVALAVSEVLTIFFLPGNKKRQTLVSAALFLTVACSLGTLLVLMNRGSEWLTDSDLGGRLEQLDTLKDITLFTKPVADGIREMVYITVMYKYGLIGLFLLGLMLATPILGFFVGDRQSALRRGLVLGAVNYLVLCFADGAFVFIPVMAFFWFLTAMLWCRNPALFEFDQQALPPAPGPSRFGVPLARNS